MTDLADIVSTAFWRVNPPDADPAETREWLEAFDADGAKPIIQSRAESEAAPTNTKPPAALPAPAPDPKKPPGGKPTLRRIK